MKLIVQVEPSVDSRCLFRVLTLVTIIVPQGGSSTETG